MFHRARLRGRRVVFASCAAVAALTIYDMVKAVDKAMVIGDVCLVEKRGGKSGLYRRSGYTPRKQGKRRAR